MADLSKLLRAPADELKSPLIPVGTWHGRIKSVRFKEARTDKNDNEYIPVMFAISLVSPGPDVDPVEARALNGQLDGETLFYRENLYRNSDLIKLRNLLESLGVPSAGRTLPEMANEARNLDCQVEVEHEQYDGETVNTVRRIYAPKTP
jgi:hypothetical protein